jgi:hypothetical protein
MDGGATLFGNIEAPTVFGLSWSKYYKLWGEEVSTILTVCDGL